MKASVDFHKDMEIAITPMDTWERMPDKIFCQYVWVWKISLLLPPLRNLYAETSTAVQTYAGVVQDQLYHMMGSH